MRLGLYPCVIRSGTLAERVYKEQMGTLGDSTIYERHRHRFEFNPRYRGEMEKRGFIVSADSPDGMLAEIVEIQNHPYMIATQNILFHTIQLCTLVRYSYNSAIIY